MDHNVPCNSESTVANIFLIYSPLHYLAAESIAAHFGQNARNYLFFLKQEFRWCGPGIILQPIILNFILFAGL